MAGNAQVPAQATMDATEVVRIVRLMDAHGIFLCLDGGWAVDALLGQQTRPHKDLDVALNHQDLPRLLELLEASGYRRFPTPGDWEHNFVLADEAGRRVDLHTYVMDSEGKIVGGVDYPPASLTGKGMILEQAVHCIEARWLVNFHTGYALDAEDYHDVRLLCEHFGFTLPLEFLRFENGSDQEEQQSGTE
ncbi:MAG: nucleotidyltransferase family protein [Anaerolineaceae bacterium]